MLLAQTGQGIPQPQNGGQLIDIAGQAADISPIQNLPSLIEIGASAILTLGVLAALLYLLLGAFKWTSSRGEKGKVEEGREMMTQAVIGLVVLASVFVIYGLVLNFLGLGDRFGMTVPGTPPAQQGNPLPQGGAGIPAAPGQIIP